MKVMVILLQLIRIIPYTYYSFVEALATLILIPLLDKITIYGMIIIYQLWYNDENTKPKRKVKSKRVRKDKGYKMTINNERLKYIKGKETIAYNKYDSGSEIEQIFDTDSLGIEVDNICSGCISNKVEDFVAPLKDCHRVIKGFRCAKTPSINIGKIKWSWLDDIGSAHEFKILSIYFIPSGGVCLLSSQHYTWSQGEKNYKTRGAGKETTFDGVLLFCNSRK